MNQFELKNTKKYFGDYCALNIPYLSLKHNHFSIIYGPNAAGKTTLLNLLAFLDTPDSGEILFYGKNGNSSLRKKITLVMQNPYLFNTTVLKNVISGLKYRSMRRSKAEKKVAPIMEELELWKMRDKNVTVLSGGERRKVALARALVLNTDVIIFDEPTTHLDTNTAELIENQILKIAKNKTLIMTTHDLHQAHRLTDTIIYINEGKIIETPLWNIYQATLVEGTGNVKNALISDKITILVATGKKGYKKVAVNPRDIVLSRQRIDSSALNNLKGKIVNIGKTNTLINVKVDTGIELHTFITENSFRKMNLNIGDDIYLTFKASAVEVF